jgi:hypothetical protein
MATVLELVTRGELIKLDPELDDDQQEFRVLYASPRLQKWLQEVLPTLGSTWNPQQTPLQQFDALMDTYASGEVMHYGWAFKPIRYADQGIWELKTADVRVFGWFHAVDCFIGHVADAKQRLVDHPGLYHGYGGEVFRFRKQLDLDEPKFVPGEDPHDVVSDFDLPD